jgi:proteasome lid subunit RPN8/RPN11
MAGGMPRRGGAFVTEPAPPDAGGPAPDRAGRDDEGEVLERISALAEGDPEREVCGFVVRRRVGHALEAVPVRNVAGEAEGPPGLTDDPRRAFLADPSALLRLLADLRTGGGEIVACYHSHVDGPACFSAADRENALVDGRPAIPGAEHLVVSVRDGAVREIARFRWNGHGFDGSVALRRDGHRAPRRSP